MAETTLMRIPVNKLTLDLDNPRMYHHGASESGKVTVDLKDEEIMRDIIENDNELPELIKSIQAEGIRDAIYVIPEGNTFRVIEGNRRTVVMRQLSTQGYTNPQKPELDFTTIPAQVLPEDTSEKEVMKSKLIWQTGKSRWGVYNVAAAIYRMRHQFLMNEDDIADVAQTSSRDIKETLRAYKLYSDYVEETGDENTSRFSFFSKECPANVRRWVAATDENKEEYFNWIKPGPEQRIRSVSTRGGLRDFKDVINNDAALLSFRTDETMTVEEALEIVKDDDITKGRPWVKQIEKVTAGLNGLELSEIARLVEENYKPHLIALKRAVTGVLDDMQ
jgi:hypothetical protein